VGTTFTHLQEYLAACRREKQDGIKNNPKRLNRRLISAKQA